MENMQGSKVLLRTDLNLPLKGGEPQKTLRFEKYIETVRKLSEQGAKTAVLAHQGRPGRDDFTSLEKHAELLRQELDTEVHFVESILSGELQRTVEEMSEGDVALLENVRMMSEELKNMPGDKHADDFYLAKVSRGFDLYINDGFSVAHRSQGSIVGIPQLLESRPGPVMKEELKNCRKIGEEFDSGVLVLGGEKPSDLIGIVEALIDSVDKVLLGGVPGEVALISQGHDLGEKQDWIEERGLDERQDEFAELIEKHREKFELPEDLKTGSGNTRVEKVEGMTWDIGEKTAERYAEIIEKAEAALMKGPMGAFEDYPEGTQNILEALKKCGGFTVMGGGHTSSLVKEFGFSMDDFDHVSIAGGAFVRTVSGGELPAAEALDI
ncbi:MAG: phosphoglycerate kinase [Candidatus Nanohaloarchaea archaeon]